MARKIAEAVAEDRRLRVTFIGILVSGLALVAIVIYAGVMRI
jgi:hypothetical protein